MRYKYSRYIANLLDEIDMEELLSRLSDLLLSSGFQNPYGLPGFGDDLDADDDRTLQALHDAILEALFSGDMLSDDALDRLMGDPADADQETVQQQLEQLVQDIIEQMAESGFITLAPDLEEEQEQRRRAGPGDGEGEDGDRPIRFEVTDRSLDFLGYRALRDLLGSLGRSSVGRHETRDSSTGIEATDAPKPYEFGDVLNLDPSATILHAVRRAHRSATVAPEFGDGVEIDYEDLMVAQGDYHSSCATVIMLDCSHSMILYGEDRFTPAKRVAMALANLIRMQYPGDTLKVVLFHDSAEEIPLREMGRVRVGPYYTNTREGLRLARRILERQQKDMRQIVMITDGKPSALTQPDGRIYKNAFGLDPFIVSETITEVAACRRAGILINTFMLARDYELVSFVRKVAEICHGKAYFTTPHTLGRYVLMDYMDKKTRTVH